MPELIEALLDDVNALPQLCLSDDERWSKPYLVPMGWLTQETILCELQAEVPSTVACGGTQERSTQVSCLGSLKHWSSPQDKNSSYIPLGRAI